jgi:hypothetical protein
VIYGFISYASFLLQIRPELTIRYIVPDTSQRPDSFVVGSYQDISVAYMPPFPASSQLMYLQAGISDRGRLYFNMSGIPRSANIVAAELTIVREPTLSLRNELTADSVDAQFLVTDTSPPVGSTFLTYRTKPTGDETGSTFTGDVRGIVQQWVTGKQNYGMALKAANDLVSMDRFVLYGAADSLNRPRLRIVYSVVQ